MAEHILFLVIRDLGKLFKQELQFLKDVPEQLRWVERELQRIKHYLKDADSRRKEDGVKQWLKEIRDVAYDMDDIIDTYVLEVKYRQRADGFFKWLSLVPKLKAQHDVGMEIERIKKRIQEISAGQKKYDLRKLGGGKPKPPKHRPILPHDFDDADVVGFEGERKAVVNQLLDSKKLRRGVVSIVGGPGRGKTTLAGKVDRSREVRKHFDFRVWLPISQNYEVTHLLKKVLEKIRKISKKESGEDEVYFTEQVRSSLRRRRYLIVMDDVWRPDVWKEMRAAFPDNNNGSRVLFTTRFLEVAKSADPGATPCELKDLSLDDSVKLLLKKALPDQKAKTRCPEELEGLAEKLAKRCAGLPLALVVLGSLLAIKDKTYSAWSRVERTMDWQSEGRECMEILATSYKDLPHDLKPCFLYLCSFPRNYEIPAGALIKMWIAEGFVPEERRKTMEEVAENFLEELTQRCLVEVVERNSSGAVKICRIHDLLHDLATSRAEEDDFLAVCTKKMANPVAARRAAFRRDFDANDLKRYVMPTKLRSLLSFNVRTPCVVEFKLLRVMELRGARHLRVLPKEMENMVHLRYIGLRHSGMDKLPSSIGRLLCLETLDVRNTGITSAPTALWKIATLRHAYFCKYAVTIAGPPRDADLPDLQTLGVINVPTEWNERLPNVTNLRKLRLRICNDFNWNVVNNLLAKLNLLVSLTIIANGINPATVDTRKFQNHTHLRSLWLDGTISSRSLGTHKFPPHLTKLTLTESRLKQDPMPTLERLKSLRVLRLGYEAYVGKQMICTASGFPELRRFELDHLKQLEAWTIEARAMPKLTHLCMDCCSGLKKFPELQHLATLRTLKLYKIPAELKRGIEKNGKHRSKISHVPSLYISSHCRNAS